MTERKTARRADSQEAPGNEQAFARAVVYLRVSTREQAEMGGERRLLDPRAAGRVSAQSRVPWSCRGRGVRRPRRERKDRQPT